MCTNNSRITSYSYKVIQLAVGAGGTVGISTSSVPGNSWNQIRHLVQLHLREVVGGGLI
jgi:hypothetical protein